jgi:hypothetical protein
MLKNISLDGNGHAYKLNKSSHDLLLVNGTEKYAHTYMMERLHSFMLLPKEPHRINLLLI